MSRKILKLDFIVIPSPNNNKYIVLDGNTRLSVLTDMKKQNHPFVKNGYELNCDIYTDKKEAKDILSETHTKESKTEWNLLNQARFNQNFGVFSDRDKTILQIFDHLQEIDEIFTFRNVEYTVRNCLETPLGDTFIKFYIKCYECFYECDIVLPMSGLKEIDKKRLYELLMMFINNSKDSKSKQLIKNAIKRHYRDVEKDNGELFSTTNLPNSKNDDEKNSPNPTDQDIPKSQSTDISTNPVLDTSDHADLSSAISSRNFPNRKFPKVDDSSTFNTTIQTLQELYSGNNRDNISYLNLGDIKANNHCNIIIILYRVLLESLLIEYFKIYPTETIKNNELNGEDSVKFKVESIANKYLKKLKNEFPDESDIQKNVNTALRIIQFSHDTVHGVRYYNPKDTFCYYALQNLYPVLYLLIKQINIRN